MDQNQATYSLPQIAASYARESHLQAPEETILRLMLPGLTTARMLDLGVGGGRTTLHFAKWVREYVGADYSPSMIAQCQRRFSGYPNYLSFRVCDARSMGMFETGLFDFTLFSFNGIDYVTHEDRLRILKEIRRVGKPGGHFCFSSHNLNWCANFFEWRRMISLNPKFTVRAVKRLVRRFFLNRGLRAAAVKHSPYILFNDGAHRNLRTYYIRPLEQLAQLQADFTGVRVFSLASGVEITDENELSGNEDAWLYYLCQLR
jgi:ubiquinone/menaquinone biosynthesis C-methylase UbiE